MARVATTACPTVATGVGVVCGPVRPSSLDGASTGRSALAIGRDGKVVKRAAMTSKPTMKPHAAAKGNHDEDMPALCFTL